MREARCRTNAEQWRRFKDFADDLLPLHDASVALDKFHLHVAHEVINTNIGRWIRRSLACRPTVLHVSYDHHELRPRQFDFPSGAGAGASLRTLHLWRVERDNT
ncbi:hypothetical protein E2562_023204 [Oryza meyeriana var. granulata]|uniref:Uncharacterized protein n=1 Tax=Oryza meyeriana var. granulata TaxID=110450 RepID=A0A6G1BZL4_9ORYZ|nr:hypothetical protein E2562_023204 [Oryza meyeriana var. granulata]